MTPPSVTLIVAMRNERASIEQCLLSLVHQRYAGSLQIIVADGGSTDGSRPVAEQTLANVAGAIVIENPRQIQAAGWNLGIDAASGDIVGIVSGHAIFAEDYVAAAVAALDRTGADMVGGPVRSIGEGPSGEAIALAGRSRFGVGGASFRYLAREARVDTVYMGLCRRELYRRLRFDETMVRNQDDELSYRLLDEGGVIVCDPAIRSWYRNRHSFRDLWWQYFSYGFWKAPVMARHPRQVRPRHVVPSLFVGSLVAAAATAPVRREGRLALALALFSYVVANGGAAVATGARARRPSLIPRIAAAYATMHVSYGLGLLVGAARMILRRHPARRAARPLATPPFPRPPR